MTEPSSSSAAATHLYSAMEEVERRRRERDRMYDLFTSEDASDLDALCADLGSEILRRYSDASRRLRCMVERVCADSNRLAKHAFVLFALYQEPWFVERFLRRKNVDPNKFGRFVQHELKHSCEQLLTGRHTSLQAFTEDARWQYCMI